MSNTDTKSVEELEHEVEMYRRILEYQEREYEALEAAFQAFVDGVQEAEKEAWRTLVHYGEGDSR